MSDYTDEVYVERRPRRSQRVSNHYYEAPAQVSRTPVMDWSGLDAAMRAHGHSLDEGFRSLLRTVDEQFRELNRELARVSAKQRDTYRFLMQAAISAGIVIFALFMILFITYWN